MTSSSSTWSSALNLIQARRLLSLRRQQTSLVAARAVLNRYSDQLLVLSRAHRLVADQDDWHQAAFIISGLKFDEPDSALARIVHDQIGSITKLIADRAKTVHLEWLDSCRRYTIPLTTKFAAAPHMVDPVAVDPYNKCKAASVVMGWRKTMLDRHHIQRSLHLSAITDQIMARSASADPQSARAAIHQCIEFFVVESAMNDSSMRSRSLQYWDGALSAIKVALHRSKSPASLIGALDSFISLTRSLTTFDPESLAIWIVDVNDSLCSSTLSEFRIELLAALNSSPDRTPLSKFSSTTMTISSSMTSLICYSLAERCFHDLTIICGRLPDPSVTVAIRFESLLRFTNNSFFPERTDELLSVEQLAERVLDATFFKDTFTSLSERFLTEATCSTIKAIGCFSRSADRYANLFDIAIRNGIDRFLDDWIANFDWDYRHEDDNFCSPEILGLLQWLQRLCLGLDKTAEFLRTVLLNRAAHRISHEFVTVLLSRDYISRGSIQQLNLCLLRLEMFMIQTTDAAALLDRPRKAIDILMAKAIA